MTNVSLCYNTLELRETGLEEVCPTWWCKSEHTAKEIVNLHLSQKHDEVYSQHVIGGVALDGNWSGRFFNFPSSSGPRMGEWFVGEFVRRGKGEEYKGSGDAGTARTDTVVGTDRGRYAGGASGSSKTKSGVARLGLLLSDFVRRDVVEAVLQRSLEKLERDRKNDPKSGPSVRTRVPVEPRSGAPVEPSATSAFRIGPNGGGGSKQITVNATHVPGLMRLLGRNGGARGALPLSECSLPVAPWCSDHPEERFSCHVSVDERHRPRTGVTAEAGVTVTRAVLSITRVDRPGEGWGNDLWLRVVQGGGAGSRSGRARAKRKDDRADKDDFSGVLALAGEDDG